jgi:hypothetical protein
MDTRGTEVLGEPPQAAHSPEGFTAAQTSLSLWLSVAPTHACAHLLLLLLLTLMTWKLVTT